VALTLNDLLHRLWTDHSTGYYDRDEHTPLWVALEKKVHVQRRRAHTQSSRVTATLLAKYKTRLSHETHCHPDSFDAALRAMLREATDDA